MPGRFHYCGLLLLVLLGISVTMSLSAETETGFPMQTFTPTVAPIPTATPQPRSDVAATDKSEGDGWFVTLLGWIGGAILWVVGGLIKLFGWLWNTGWLGKVITVVILVLVSRYLSAIFRNY